MVIGVCEAYEKSYWSSLKWLRTSTHTYSISTYRLGPSGRMGRVKSLLIIIIVPIVTRWQLIRRGEIDHGSQEGVQGGPGGATRAWGAMISRCSTQPHSIYTLTYTQNTSGLHPSLDDLVYTQPHSIYTLIHTQNTLVLHSSLDDLVYTQPHSIYTLRIHLNTTDPIESDCKIGALWLWQQCRKSCEQLSQVQHMSCNDNTLRQ